MTTMSKTREEWVEYSAELAQKGDFETANKIRAKLGMDPIEDTTSSEPAAAAPEGPGLLENIANIARTYSQGSMLGYGDEIAAGLRTGIGNLLMEGSPYDYQQELAREQRGIDEFAKANPKTAMAIDLTGGLMSPANLAVPGGGAGASAVGNVGRMAATGAIQGGAEALGRSRADNYMDRLVDAAYGGVGGAVMNPAIQGAGRLLATAADPVMGLVRRAAQSPREAAEGQVGRILQSGGETPEQVAQRMQDMGPDAMLADVDRQMTELAAASRGRSSEAGQILDERLTQRQEGSAERVRGYLEEATDRDLTRGGTTEARQALNESRVAYNTENYPLLNQQTVTMDEELERVVQTPYIQKLLKDASEKFRSERRLNPYEPTPYDRMRVLPGTDDVPPGMTGARQRFRLSDMNDLKIMIDDRMRELDDLILQGKADGGDKAENSVLGGLLTSLKQNLDAQAPASVTANRIPFPGYASIRAGHERIAKQTDALDAGRRLQKTRESNLDELYEQVMGKGERAVESGYRQGMGREVGQLPAYRPRDAMDAEQQSRFRQGALDSLIEEVDRPGGDLVNYGGRLLRGPDSVKRLEMLSRDPAAAGRLEQQLADEVRMYQTMAMANPRAGSRTAILEAAGERMDDEIGRLRDTGAMMTGEPGTMMSGVFNMLRREFANPEVAREVADLLSTPGMSVDDVRRIMADRGVPETVRDRVVSMMQSLPGRAATTTLARQPAAAWATQ